MAQLVPEPIRNIFGQRFFATTFLFGAAALFVGIFQPARTWKSVLLVLGGIAVGLIFDLWRHSLRLEANATEHEQTVSQLTQERDDAILERDQAYEGLERQAEVEAENIRLTIERDEAVQRSATPPALLEQVLASMDGQLEILGVVQKHRAIQAAGDDWQWPVTGIRMHDESLVSVTAHADNPTAYAGEFVALTTGEGFISTAQAASSGSQLTILLPFALLPEPIQESLLTNGTAPSGGYLLRLIGLSLAPYDRMEDEQIERLAEALRAAASAVSGAVVGEPPPLMLEDTEEDQ